MYMYVWSTGHYICRVTNPFMNDKGVVFSNYTMVTVVGKSEVPSSNPRILQGTRTPMY